MRFGFLGLDADTLDLARSVEESGHVLVAAFGIPPQLLDEWASLAPQARHLENWEELLGGDSIEAVVVSRGKQDDQRADQLRVLFQSGMPLIVAHPIHESMLVYYELDMMRQESDPVILPYVPEAWHPAIEQLSHLSQNESENPWGNLEQISFERELADRSRASVIAHFARDVEIVRKLVGPLDQVAAMTSRSSGTSSFESLAVQMSGPAGHLVRWSVLPAGTQPKARLTLVGQTGRAVLDMFAAKPWQLELPSGVKLPVEEENDSDQRELPTHQVFDDWEPGEAALTRFAEALRGGVPSPSWVEAAQDLELVDAIDRSLRKGRTIDLHFEDHTEHGTFKGMMAAGGCGVLIMALVLLIVATTAVNLGLRAAAVWPYLLLGLLVVFLLIQLLKLAFPQQDER